jgi:ERF superfamily
MAKEPIPQETLTAEAVILRAMNAVMSEVDYVQKKGENDFHGYKYATEADVLDRLRPAMVKHGLVLIPSVQQVSSIDQHGNTTVSIHYTLAHISGAVWPTPVIAAGCGNDKNKNGVGDKGLYKAITGANKYMLFKLFQIETGNAEPEDSEGDRQREAANNAARQFYLEGGKIAISKADTADDLRKWWKDEEDNRTAAGVIRGTDEYKELHTAFVVKGKELTSKEG